MDTSESIICTWTFSVFFKSFLLKIYHIVSVTCIALEIFESRMNSGVNVFYYYFLQYLLTLLHVQYLHCKQLPISASGEVIMFISVICFWCYILS